MADMTDESRIDDVTDGLGTIPIHRSMTDDVTEDGGWFQLMNRGMMCVNDKGLVLLIHGELM
jgi:hypothetical protein